MLNKYKYTKLFKVYLMFLNPNEASDIMIDIIIFIINNNKDETGINSDNILMDPSVAPNINLIILVFLLRINDTPIKSKKSRKKFNANTKSTYIFINITD